MALQRNNEIYDRKNGTKAAEFDKAIYQLPPTVADFDDYH